MRLLRRPIRRIAAGQDAPHERARALAAGALGGPLEAPEAEWLADHLAGCRGCRGVAAAYDRQRTQLRALGERPVVPPRDLWARTAATIELESRHRRALGRFGSGTTGSLVGALGLVLVATATILAIPGGDAGPAGTPGPLASGEGVAEATPIAVQPGVVGYVTVGPDGGWSVYFATVDRVCADEASAQCLPLGGDVARTIPLPGVPRSFHLSPARDLVVVLDDGVDRSGGGVLVFSVPTPVPTPSSGTPEPEPSPTVAASATGLPTDPVAPPPPGASAPPPTRPTSDASGPPRTDGPATATPTEPPASDPPASPTVDPASSGDPTPTGAPAESLVPGPSPTPVEALAIASGVVVRDESAAYSPDGRWFAFSAWPKDGSHGPDIYLWRVGDTAAEPVTTDHRSVFASWLENRILGSRIVETDPADAAATSGPSGAAGASAAPGSPGTAATAAPTLAPSPAATPRPNGPPGRISPPGRVQPIRTPVATAPASPPATDAGASGEPSVTSGPTTGAEAFVLDPETREVRPLAFASAWRPVAAPDGRTLVFWDGLLAADETGSIWRPATGRLVLVQRATPVTSDEPFAPDPGVAPSGAPGATGSGEPGSGASPSGPAFVGELQQVITTGPIGDVDVRWDPSGTRVGIWIGEPDGARAGRLSVYAVRRDADGTLRPAEPLLVGIAALPGFSMNGGRVAWVSPPDEAGNGGHIEVMAWSDGGVGSVESAASIERSAGFIVLR
jgi:hypothetical protein